MTDEPNLPTPEQRAEADANSAKLRVEIVAATVVTNGSLKNQRIGQHDDVADEASQGAVLIGAVLQQDTEGNWVPSEELTNLKAQIEEIRDWACITFPGARKPPWCP